MEEPVAKKAADLQPPELDLKTMTELVQRAKDGDRLAHSEICRQVQDDLTRIAERQLEPSLRSKVNPSDIVQATLSRMIHGFADFRSTSSAEFYAWLNKILKNEIRSTRRDLYRDRRDIRREDSGNDDESPVLPGRQPTPSSITIRKENIERFHKVMRRLPEDYATVIQLRGIDELPFSEVAAKMNRSVDAVSKLFQRALIAMQKELAKTDETDS
ncbi:MAG TPA: sigma-70 family RNA polymerase sigma factor [Pirellulaceae bacterium]|nr:sigma-70 family RNA polymerase sigma factor [Pirellulaceae bacterium]HMO94166.1 sigma-70 family RNA polymerase sigma factor [Pirellulaceae bacterium]HMP71295.1 sigma-70 family RNA polymerase sigma factor [Pirellulaceae bacterium]